MNDLIVDTDSKDKADRKIKDIRKQQLDDVKTVLSTSSGRRLLWRLLEMCQTFGSIYSETPGTMAYLSGKQDLGHFLMAEIVEADEFLLFKLMKENQKGVKK